MTDQPTTQNVRPEDLSYFERPPLITRPRKHYHYPAETEAELRAKRRPELVEGRLRARGEQIGGTSSTPGLPDST
jgi:hypothetical protein